MIINPIDVSR